MKGQYEYRSDGMKIVKLRRSAIQGAEEYGLPRSGGERSGGRRLENSAGLHILLEDGSGADSTGNDRLRSCIRATC